MNQRTVPADLDVGVIYTHERKFIEPLLTSLSGSCGSVRMRVVLVDNVSSGGVTKWQGLHEPTLVVRNSRRLHYAANLNRILAHATARYVLLLNTDMYFDPAEQALAKLVDFMDATPEAGVVGCRLYHADGKFASPARRFPTPGVILARRLPRLWRRPESVARHLYDEQSETATFACEWLSGCLLLLRRECVDQVGGFDAGFRKYFEDVDYCWRARRAGWDVVYYGGTYAFHWEQRASQRVVSRDALQHMTSYARWLAKRAGAAMGRSRSQEKRRSSQREQRRRAA